MITNINFDHDNSFHINEQNPEIFHVSWLLPQLTPNYHTIADTRVFGSHVSINLLRIHCVTSFLVLSVLTVGEPCTALGSYWIPLHSLAPQRTKNHGIHKTRDLHREGGKNRRQKHSLCKTVMAYKIILFQKIFRIKKKSPKMTFFYTHYTYMSSFKVLVLTVWAVCMSCYYQI